MDDFNNPLDNMQWDPHLVDGKLAQGPLAIAPPGAHGVHPVRPMAGTDRDLVPRFNHFMVRQCGHGHDKVIHKRCTVAI